MLKAFTLLFSLLLGLFSLTALAQAPTEPLGLSLEGYDYPYPVKYFDLKIEDKSLCMAYMDIAPTSEANNRTVMLLHGNRFFGAYWQKTIKFLAANGYRVIVPDQVGYGKSSKENIHYSFHLFAKNTDQLLNHLQIKKVDLVGHSLGGMIAARFALMYPEKINKLVLEDPVGLEDYRLSIPFKSIDETYAIFLNTPWENHLQQNKELFANWNEQFASYVEATYRISLNPQYSKVAFINAVIYEMLYTQPIVYELEYLKVPTLIIYGDQDRVAPGKNFANKEMQKTLGNYPALSKNAAEKIPNAQLHVFKDVGHVPHLEATQEFNQVLLDYISH